MLEAWYLIRAMVTYVNNQSKQFLTTVFKTEKDYSKN